MQSDMYRPSNMIVFLLGFLLIHTSVYARAPACCSSIQSDKCRKSCHQVHNQESLIPQMQILLTAAEGCPPEMADFWQCINNTVPAVKMMSEWPGRICCDLAIGRDCRRRCNMAEKKDYLTGSCRQNAESSLFTCIQNQEDGNHCCDKATATSCRIVCQGVYLTDVSNKRATRNILAQHCHQTDKRVEQCVHRKWQPASRKNQNYLPCCDKAQTAHCRSTCRNALRTVMSDDDMVEELIKACSQPQPTDPMWQCFLYNPSAKKNETTPMSRIDNAKLQCCGKASSNRCRDLCTQTFKKGWSYHSDFESSCSYIQPVSTVESNMHNCLTDVDQPCKLGCSGLTFCSNYNHRPTELFRSCTVEADAAAQKVYNSWKNGVIHLPQMIIPVKDISQCKPAMWKAIACALEIKPCSSQQSLITLCKEDCLFILTKCVDAIKLSGDKTVPALCNALPSKSTAGACVSMDTYLTESPYATKIGEVTHPCNPNPCAADEICRVRRRKCKHSHDCLPYVCHKACSLGQVSRVLVPRGSTVRLVNPNADMRSQKDCYSACHCSSHGMIEDCGELSCLSRDACTLGHENIREHGDQFTVDGSQCMCHAGELLCSRRSCQPDNSSPLYLGMPGNCPADYEPVCGANGKSYPNNCLAKCAGMSHIIAHRACSDVDVCADRPCSAGYRCVPRLQICLNELLGLNCPQFECVPESGQCDPHRHDPACSSTGEEFTNVCLLYAHGRTLGYRGHCQNSCSNTGVVCGHDGETYSSECAAYAARVTVDYFSKCQAYGNLTAGGSARSATCARVQCPPIYPSQCEGIIPPGGCCPICAAQLKLLWDPRLMGVAASHTKSNTVSAMDILTSLSDHISVQECDVFGYVSVNGELVVIIAPVVFQPTALQAEACQTEAERIHNLIKMGSPNIASYLILSPFLLASMERSTVTLPVMLDSTYISDPLSSGENNSGDRNSSAAYLPSHPAYLLLIVILCLWMQAWLRNL